jgi:predicted transposase/invertase (TIGR01784 family)
MKRDSLFYRIFQQAPTLLFELLAETPANAAAYRFDSVEIKQTSFRIDGVFLPPDPSGTVYVCEVQFQPDAVLYERMLSEAALYFYRYRDRCCDWRLVAIYPSQTLEQADLAPHQLLIDGGKLVRIYLDQLGDLEDLPVGLGLMALTILEDEAAAHAAQQLARRVQNQPDERAIIELISTILFYKFINLSREEIERMFTENIEGTRLYRDVERGGKQKMVIRLLKHRFATELPPAILTQIQALSYEQVDDLGDALLDFSSLEDLPIWLDEHCR